MSIEFSEVDLIVEGSTWLIFRAFSTTLDNKGPNTAHVACVAGGSGYPRELRRPQKVSPAHPLPPATQATAHAKKRHGNNDNKPVT